MTTPLSLRRLAAAVGLGKLRRRVAEPGPVADVWGEQAGTWSVGGVRHWTELAEVQGVINRRVSGDATVDPYQYFLGKYLAGRLPVRNALTVGCGAGDLERGLCQYGFANRHDALDVAPGAIEKATASAEAAGLRHIHYSVADGNALKLEPASYDVVFGVHSIHHIERLESLFGEVSRALRPGGYFFMNEFVGPTRFQWTDRQLEVVNGLLRALPESVRRSTADGRLKREVPRPTVEAMIATDPSEAVRSGEILGIARSFFDVVEVRPYGGSVLQILLDDIAGNFARSEDGGRDLLAAVCELEWALVTAGDLASDFAVVVAQPRR
jgi:SAM-dependent methyltransferase